MKVFILQILHFTEFFNLSVILNYVKNKRLLNTILLILKIKFLEYE